MNIKLLKKIAATATLAAICISLVACDKKTGPVDAPETTAPETTAPETTAPETTAPETTAPETTAPETTAPETTAPETTAPETTAPEITAPEVTVPEVTVPEQTVPPETPEEDLTLSGDWLDLQFILDDVGYQLNDPYKKLEANGWYFDMADYGYANGYVLNPGEKTYGTIYLKNDAYDKKINVIVGLRNNSDAVKDIYECDIWNISVQIEFASKLVEPHPEMTIGNGLKFGDTAQQVIDSCGPCEDIFVSDSLGYRTFTYRVDFDYYLKITVYDEFGITKIQLEDYSQ